VDDEYEDDGVQDVYLGTEIIDWPSYASIVRCRSRRRW
jgi:hypothetical protein